VTSNSKQSCRAAVLVAAALVLGGCNSGGDNTFTPPPTQSEVPVEVPTGPSPIRITPNTDPQTFAALNLRTLTTMP